MQNLQVVSLKGTQIFINKEIPVIEGGFGEGKRALTDKSIAEIHDIKNIHVRELINRNISRFKEKLDFIDLKVIVQNDNKLINDLGYSNMQISKSEHIYLLSERGYAKLIKIMDTDLAWEIHDKLIDEYFKMKEIIKPLSPMELMELQFKAIKQVSEEVETIKSDVDIIKNTMTIDYGQANELNMAHKSVGIRVLGGRGSQAYKDRGLRSRLYQMIWREFKQYFNVNSYHNTPAKRYEEALNYIYDWLPNNNIRIEIESTNRYVCIA